MKTKIYNPKGKDSFIRNKNILESSGVYFLLSKSELLYIGYTGNLRKRIAQHLSKSFLNVDIINPKELWKVMVIFTKDKYEAKKLEESLLKLIPTKHNGSCNWFSNEWLGEKIEGD